MPEGGFLHNAEGHTVLEYGAANPIAWSKQLVHLAATLQKHSMVPVPTEQRPPWFVSTFVIERCSKLSILRI